jgi:transaldolase
MTPETLQVLQKLLFATPADQFPSALAAWRSDLRAEYPGATAERQAEIAEALAANAVDLRSALPAWNLRCSRFCSCEPCREVSPEALAAASAESLAALREWGQADVAAKAEADIASVHASNLWKLTRMSLEGKANTWWGNDYATGLWETMRRGAAMVTTNPVLVNLARKEAPAVWTPVRDQLQAQHPGYSPTDLAYALTIQVVVSNARLLRPVWELTGGEMGYVSLQLSPKNATDSEQMIREAKWVWSQLEQELGGVPNCVFKVPGTRAGIAVAAELTASKMGVNVTVNFALPQQIAFAAAIEHNSQVAVSYRTQMDGRLDDPVGDELKASCADWDEVKTWCTTAIRQREYRLLNFGPERGGLGFTKSRPLPASGRGPWNILRSVHNEPEVPLFLTVFPNRQEEFDAEPRDIAPDGMWTPLPAGHLDKLNKSKLFRQAYEPDGMTVDEFDNYLPVVATLTHFNEGYDEFVAWVSGR